MDQEERSRQSVIPKTRAAVQCGSVTLARSLSPRQSGFSNWSTDPAITFACDSNATMASNPLSYPR